MWQTLKDRSTRNPIRWVLALILFAYVIYYLADHILLVIPCLCIFLVFALAIGAIAVGAALKRLWF